MVDSVAEVMSPIVRSVTPDTHLREIAQIMRDENVGDVVVTESGHLRGIVTDRDIVVRCLAAGGDPDRVRAQDVCSSELVTVPRQSSVGDAVHAMRSATVRRLPVVEGDEVVGVVTMGDLARAVDSDSALADVSAAEPNT
ncbi:oxidoreductase [Nocardiopsis terrae]|uniref:CBS domain-containing protein n=1 Tax=Nocardiopsis terrae TaxID=372655 RepID=A0ABR9HGC3_9ACTN|nr:CBS domain-containing protein [Nocardiopsis terrae]MBE1458073.1 CBS domain-containing protein [Nocardiopsis terrae]GHC82332.1 oxidoreductase [Nocardiopsis terrae]